MMLNSNLFKHEDCLQNFIGYSTERVDSLISDYSYVALQDRNRIDPFSSISNPHQRRPITASL